MNYRKLEGVIAATVTPFGKNGEVSYDAIIQLTHFLIEKGVHGLFPCGSTGEGILMSLEERKQVAETVVQETAERIPVIVHTGAVNLKEAVELTRHAQKIGADGAALIPPYYYTIDHATLYRYFAEVAKSVPDFPLYVYNIPANVKNVITPKLVSQLQSEFNNVVGLKESSMDFQNFIDFQQQLPEDFCILMGNDAQIFSSILMGGNGAIAASATAFPEPAVEIYERLKAGDLKQAKIIQDKVTKLRAILRKYQPIAPYKKSLEFRGIPAGLPRKPLRSLTNNESSQLRQELENIGML